MKNDYSVVIRKDGEWWIGWNEEIPGVNAQEKSSEDLVKRLREALVDILDLNRAEARGHMEGEFEEVAISA